MSYSLRDVDRHDSGLPAIRKSAIAWEAAPRLTTMESDDGHHHNAYSRHHSAIRVDSGMHYPRPPSPTHRRQVEMHEQLRLYKEELAKKERLISQLTSLETPRPKGVDFSLIEDSFSADRMRETATLKSELAAMSVRVEGLQSQNRDLQVQVDMREEKIKELRMHCETAREGEAKCTALLSSLRQKTMEYEAAHGTLEGAATRSEVAISSLQRENREFQERVAELESRLRQHSEDKDRYTTDRQISEARYAEVITKLSSLIGFEDSYNLSPDYVVAKTTDIIQENALLKGKIASMKEYLSGAELETKASRETIMRLVSESEREQKHNNRYTMEMESLRVERDGAVAKENEYRREIQLLQERLEASARSLAVTRRELEEKEARYGTFERDMHTHDMSLRNAEGQYKAFKETLAALLSDNYVRVEPYEDSIRDRLQQLVASTRDRTSFGVDMGTHPMTFSRSTSPVRMEGSGRARSPSPARRAPLEERSRSRSRSRTRYVDDGHHARPRPESPSGPGVRHMSPHRHCSPSRMATGEAHVYDRPHVELLERKISELTAQLESQYELQRSADHKGRRIEDGMLEMQERLRKAEGELAAGDALRDGLRIDKERYLRFLERISTALGMDPFTADLCLDSIVDAIHIRAEQLMKMEHDQLVDRKTHIYNLQRKIKALKEQMESKDLHMDLLRKKVAAMEERLVGKSEAEREKDEEYIKNKKLLKLVERYKRELNETRLECNDLKARLLDGAELKNRTMDQERELEVLETKVGQLERVRQKQAHKIAGLADTIDDSTSKFDEKREQVANTVGALSSELRTTKSALNEVTKRERQLLDLRSVMARMLGLNVTNLAIPDYEIISRLEKLILANQSNVTTAVVLDTALEDMEEGFRAGYSDAARTLATRNGLTTTNRRVNTGGNRSQSFTRSHTRNRSRSMSPNRKKDTRAY